MRGRSSQTTRGIAGAAALAMALGALPAFAQTAPLKWGPHIDLEGKLGNQRRLGEGDLFVPLLQNGTSLLFGNLKTRFDDGDSREVNLGLGVRHMLEAGWNLGTYAYFDRRRSEHDNYFNQVTLGAEALSLDWDLRVNAYIPEGRRRHNVDSLNTAELSGTSVIFRGGEERSLRGFDGEIGWRLPLFDGAAPRQLRLYAGAYRFYADGVSPVQGPRGRAELIFDEVAFLWSGSRLALGGEIQNDGPRGTTGFASARLRLPLQLFGGGEPPRLTPMERRMTDPVVRDIDVVAQAGAYIAEIATTTASGAAITVISSASTSGAALPGAVNAAGANSTVLLSGTFSTTATVTLQTGQTLMGGGTLSVRSPSGRTATLTTAAAGISAATAGGSGAPAIALASNATLTGLSVSNNTAAGNGAFAVLADGISGAVISGNTITARETGAGLSQAVQITNGASAIVVRGNTITANGVAGQQAVGLGMADGGATISTNTIGASGGTTNRYVTLSNANIASGSSGNTTSGGSCSVAAAGTGSSITFTNAAACGP